MKSKEIDEKEQRESIKKMVPKMNSLQEERDFWDNVSNAFEYSSPVKLDLELPKRSKKKLVTIRLSEDQVELMKKLANAQDKKYQTMARDWLNDRLRSEIKMINTSGK